MKQTFYQAIAKYTAKKYHISPHIFKVTFDLLIFPVSIWIVENQGSYFLIDTGMGNMASYAVETYLGSKPLAAVFLTHGHSDHVGGIAQLKDLYPTLPLMIDKRELPYVSGQKPYPRRKKVESVNFNTNWLEVLDSERAHSFLADAGLIPIFTPGHSPGHTCYYHAEDDVLIAGDLLTTSRLGHLKPPMKAFTADMPQALKTAHDLLQTYSQTLISVCHGGEVANALEEMEKRKWYQKK